jgi:hypothetical protein
MDVGIVGGFLGVKLATTKPTLVVAVFEEPFDLGVNITFFAFTTPRDITTTPIGIVERSGGLRVEQGGGTVGLVVVVVVAAVVVRRSG